jgi:hypothetical protein
MQVVSPQNHQRRGVCYYSTANMIGRDSERQPERQPFKTLYCSIYQCPPEAFKRRLFWRCLHRRALPFAKLLMLIRPRFFRLDLDFIEEAGNAESFEEMVRVINGFRQDCQTSRRFVHDDLSIRMSGTRLLNVFKKTRQKAHYQRRTTPDGQRSAGQSVPEPK